jgi:Fic family protein
MSFAKYNNQRIRNHLLKSNPAEFTAADIAKTLNLSTHCVAAHLRDIPEVRIKQQRRHARIESGILYCLVIEP